MTPKSKHLPPSFHAFVPIHARQIPVPPTRMPSFFSRISTELELNPPLVQGPDDRAETEPEGDPKIEPMSKPGA